MALICASSMCSLIFAKDIEYSRHVNRRGRNNLRQRQLDEVCSCTYLKVPTCANLKSNLIFNRVQSAKEAAAKEAAKEVAALERVRGVKVQRVQEKAAKAQRVQEKEVKVLKAQRVQEKERVKVDQAVVGKAKVDQAAVKERVALKMYQRLRLSVYLISQ